MHRSQCDARACSCKLWLAPGSILYSPLPSTLDRIKEKLQAVLDQVGTVGYVENDKDAQIVAELMEEVRDAVTVYQVSGNPKMYLCTSPLMKNWSRWRTNRPYTIRVSR